MANEVVKLARETRPSSKPPETLSHDKARANAGYARRWLVKTREQLQSAEPAEIAVFLTRLSVHFYQEDRPIEQIAVLIEDYAADLSIYPADIVAEACKRWRFTGKWWPKISELVEIAAPLHLARRQRLEWLEGRFATPPEPEPVKPTPKPLSAEQCQKLKAWLAEEGEKAAAHRAKMEAPPRPIHVPLSDEDREAVLARVEAGEVQQ